VADSLRVMKELTALGVGIALDDFGTGFSSLSYLVQLNPKVIKIDQSFVRPATGGPESDAILELIVLLGRKLGVVMLAEGVETRPQLERLRFYDCKYGQGYLWSPAVPYDQVPEVLDELRAALAEPSASPAAM
jgi:EAL domain-containing protein (putative c-di-GMP-specific phosphodiesterase class I)